MKKAIITGARGFAGSWLATELLLNDYEVIGIDRSDANIQNDFAQLSLPNGQSLSNVKIFQNNLGNQDLLEHIISDFGDCHIFHLAGSAFVPESWNCPLETLENNTANTLRILEAAKKTNWKGRFIFISSAEVYGAPIESEMPITEKTKLSPESPYALSKLVAEQFGKYYQSDSIDFLIARPFNHTGPGQKNNFAIPAFVERIILAEMNGSSYIDVGDLNSVRDFTDVRDVAQAYRLIAENGKDGEVYNICSGKPIKIQDVLSLILELTKNKIDLKVKSELLRPEGSNKRYGNSDKLKKLGWTTRIELEKTIQDIWDQMHKTLSKDQNKIPQTAQ